MIYVDVLRVWQHRARTPQARRYFGDGKPSCHMFADSEDELTAFARRLGLKPEYIQKSDRWPTHFDLTAPKRTLAVNLGAKEITRAEYVALFLQQKRT